MIDVYFWFSKNVWRRHEDHNERNMRIWEINEFRALACKTFICIHTMRAIM